MYSSLDDLVAGDRIKVIKEFSDFDNQLIPLESEWTFKNYTYFPYDGGYTFYFEEGSCAWPRFQNLTIMCLAMRANILFC